MVALSYLLVIGAFLIYYLSIIFFERKIVDQPTDILEKFLAITLIFAGISLIYYSITGQPFLVESADEYNVYIFLIGFIAVLWAVPNLLSEFSFYKKFFDKKKKK
jgi:hypothetical protein